MGDGSGGFVAASRRFTPAKFCRAFGPQKKPPHVAQPPSAGTNDVAKPPGVDTSRSAGYKRPIHKTGLHVVRMSEYLDDAGAKTVTIADFRGVSCKSIHSLKKNALPPRLLSGNIELPTT